MIHARFKSFFFFYQIPGKVACLASFSIDFSASCHAQTHFTQRLASSRAEGAHACCANNTNVLLSRDAVLAEGNLPVSCPSVAYLAWWQNISWPFECTRQIKQTEAVVAACSSKVRGCVQIHRQKVGFGGFGWPIWMRWKISAAKFGVIIGGGRCRISFLSCVASD